MISSEIRNVNGVPRLFFDGVQTAAAAYTTYFEERSRYGDFIDAGYRIFFINVSFTALPINSVTGFTPFFTGVFEDPDSPDYSEFENAAQKILDRCPDAVLIPRIYISMPGWWIAAHPDDVVDTPRGGYREVIFSDVFKKDARELLIRLVRHIKSSRFAGRIGGWMFCGGQTQEWFHHGHTASVGPCAQRYFEKWVREKYGEDGAAVPAFSDYRYSGRGFNDDVNAVRYALFANESVARTVAYFARVLKEETCRSQIVGTFYGYSFGASVEIASGSCALNAIIDCADVDFFAAPCCYTDNRAFGIDWADQFAVDSVKLHGKLPFVECDIRTFLTVGVQESRPGVYPADIYPTAKPGKPSVWSGPPTAELSAEALRKCFAHQITKASAIWWFDMFGGWYADPLLMKELTDMRVILENDRPGTAPRCEAAAFVDETGLANIFDRSPQKNGIVRTRLALGNTGVPFDSFLVEDAKRVLKNYKAAVFMQPYPSEAAKEAMRLCDSLGVAYILPDPAGDGLTVGDLRAFYARNGVHSYTAENDVVYLGNGYIGLHSAVGGEKTLALPKPRTVKAVFGADYPETTTDAIRFFLKDNAAALFEIK